MDSPQLKKLITGGESRTVESNTYSENKIFPYAELADLDLTLFEKVRDLIKYQRPNHPWLHLSDMDILKSAGLFLKDVQTGKQGITLAGIL